MNIKRVDLDSVSHKIDYGLTASATGSNTGIKFLRITDIQNDNVDWDQVPYCDCDKQEAKQYELETGDIVFARTGATTGKSYLVKNPPKDAVFASYLIRVRPKSEVLDPIFLSHFFRTTDYWKQILESSVGAAQVGFNGAKLKRLVVPLPPLPEQKRIAAILDKADRLRRLRRYALELGDTYLQSVFLEMFGDPATNPKGWKLTTLLDAGTKFVYGTSEKCGSEPKGLPVLRIPNILHGEINLDDLKYAELPEREIAVLSLKYGDLIFVRTNGNPDYVGRCAVFNLNMQCLFASYLIRARMNLDEINPLFALSYLRSPAGRKAMSPYIRTTAGQSNIGIEGLGQIPLPLPPMILQGKFAQAVQKFDRLRAQQREAERQAEHLFQSLLHRAFAGEL